MLPIPEHQRVHEHMEDLHIPFILWFSGEPTPNFTSMTAPVAIPASFHADSETMQENGKIAAEREAAAMSGTANV
jgi:hypothetical protein